MRRLLLSGGLAVLAGCGAAAQIPGSGHDPNNLPQIPVGQIYRNFQFPLYQNGQLSATLAADAAKGVTINRAETTNLKIDLYTNGKVTTTITSPDADLYVADRKLRTKHTVLVNRADMEATSQVCDFDLLNKKYLMRQNVRVVLKNFDAGASAKPPSTPGHPPPAPDETQPMAPAPAAHPSGNGDLDIPGASSDTNIAPMPPPAPANP